MSTWTRIKGWFGGAVDRVSAVLSRIGRVVDEAAELAEAAGEALVDLGDTLRDLEPRDLAWLTGPVSQAVVAAQQSALITAAVGSERLEAVRLALAAAHAGLEIADREFDKRWDKARPFIEALVQRLKDRRRFGFSHGAL